MHPLRLPTPSYAKCIFCVMCDCRLQVLFRLERKFLFFSPLLWRDKSQRSACYACSNWNTPQVLQLPPVKLWMWIGNCWTSSSEKQNWKWNNKIGFIVQFEWFLFPHSRRSSSLCASRCLFLHPTALAMPCELRRQNEKLSSISNCMRMFCLWAQFKIPQWHNRRSCSHLPN